MTPSILFILTTESLEDLVLDVVDENCVTVRYTSDEQTARELRGQSFTEVRVSPNVPRAFGDPLSNQLRRCVSSYATRIGVGAETLVTLLKTKQPNLQQPIRPIKRNMHKVMIGTPCYDGRLDVWYTNSLCNTIKLAAARGIEIIPMWVSFDALLQRARNDTVQLALETGCTDMVFIDSDIEWEPEWFFKLLDYDVDVVGGTYPKKSDIEEYVVRQLTRMPKDPTGLIPVDGLGTGFVRLSRKALEYLWEISEPYDDPKDGKERRMIFDVVVENRSLVSEDIHMFNKLRDGGFSIYLDPSMTCNHTGPKKFTGNFAAWYGKTDRSTHQPPEHKVALKPVIYANLRTMHNYPKQL